ncbi:hypothetical protein RCO28_28945 [Streptomyces sp. LHD-70]|uniref:DUF6928 family protein n=1 Tax=Streptomyces sp. LHD-70 TaxID=3072140 RepID=UPI00280C844F|nr:hypothetical protein [Streptomyces sp. LHD-70]MDQ8706469.1 hypothetical protein [Streptomyces sp. LHD-70]
MATRNLCAVAPHRPAEDIGVLPEGGADAACSAVERLFPGRYAPVADGEFRIGTYGPTVLIVGDPAAEIRVPEGHGTYAYTFQTAALAASFEVQTEVLRRLVALSPESVDFEEGEPLPFEGEFRAGECVLDSDGLSVAAQRWMFGPHADDPDPAHWLDRTQLHAFGPLPERTGPAPAAGWLRRLLGRRLD